MRWKHEAARSLDSRCREARSGACTNLIAQSPQSHQAFDARQYGTTKVLHPHHVRGSVVGQTESKKYGQTGAPPIRQHGPLVVRFKNCDRCFFFHRRRSSPSLLGLCQKQLRTSHSERLVGRCEGYLLTHVGRSNQSGIRLCRNYACRFLSSSTKLSTTWKTPVITFIVPSSTVPPKRCCTLSGCQRTRSTFSACS